MMSGVFRFWKIRQSVVRVSSQGQGTTSARYIRRLRRLRAPATNRLTIPLKKRGFWSNRVMLQVTGLATMSLAAIESFSEARSSS